MLKFIQENDFELVDEFAENEDGSVSWIYDDGQQIHSGNIWDGFKRKIEVQTGTEQVVVGQDENGDDITEEQPVFETVTINVWEKLLELEADNNSSVNVQRPTHAEKNARQAKVLAEQNRRSSKLTGVPFKDKNVSLTTDNQNGLTTVKVMYDYLGAENVFPLDFKADTDKGIEYLVFETEQEFIDFTTSFITARIGHISSGKE